MKKRENIILLLIAMLAITAISIFASDENCRVIAMLARTAACEEHREQPYRTNSDIAIGDLGGHPVDLPRNVVDPIIEYDGDPSIWIGGKATLPKEPIRTYKSKIASMGFAVRYDDGKLLHSDDFEGRNELYDSELSRHSTWVHVGINAGERYSIGTIQRMAKLYLSDEQFPSDRYVKVPESQYGLEKYVTPGIDPKTDIPLRIGYFAEDLYVKRNKQGEAIVYIECGSGKDSAYHSCKQHFDLEPDMHLEAYVSYHRSHLQHWQQIQDTVTKTIKGFKRDK